ncbi:MAG: hypothetical protein AMXMBFR64_25350 [Myxococcales bacterium]
MNDSPLETVLKDASNALADGGVPFALIGGVAAILHGNTRATRDVDLSVAVEAGAVPSVLRVLEQAGFLDVQLVGSVIQAVHANRYRLDLLLADSDFERHVIEGAAERELPGGHRVPLARLEDVVAFKLLAGRPRDLRDIEELFERHRSPDRERLCAMLALLGVPTTVAEWSVAISSDDVRPFLRRLAAAIRS